MSDGMSWFLVGALVVSVLTCLRLALDVRTLVALFRLESNFVRSREAALAAVEDERDRLRDVVAALIETPEGAEA